MSDQRGVIRRSQAITTFGIGALVDLPHHSAIVGGLDGWPHRTEDTITEPRLAEKLRRITGGPLPRLMAPPGRARSALGDGPGHPGVPFPQPVR